VNIVDDVEHCLKADTSPHLVVQLTGNRDFLHGTLYDVLTGRVTVPLDQTVVFPPFGLGVLDLAVGKYVYDEVQSLVTCTSSGTSFTTCDAMAEMAVARAHVEASSAGRGLRHGASAPAPRADTPSSRHARNRRSWSCWSRPPD
jgi:hypothetical protein